MSLDQFLILSFSLLFSAFLNYLLALYSEVDFFKLDFSKTKNEKKKVNKLKIILRNIYLTFILNSFFQLFLSMVISEIVGKKLSFWFSGEKKIIISFFSFIIGIFFIIFTEILVRFIVNKSFSEDLILNSFFLETAFLFTNISSFLKIFIRPKEKIFNNSEKDVILFIKNLAMENILEKKEADLVRAAFSFDEYQVEKFVIPWKKVVFLTLNLSFSQVQKIHSDFFFTSYPVLDENKKIIGIFNYEVFNWIKIKNENSNWQDYIAEKILVSYDMKLNKVFEILQKNFSQIAFVKKKGKIKGIITLKDILSVLVGKISDEREKYLGEENISN